ncbi:hypothetical protein [Pedobacter insulae]|uniref:DUF4760 domain-containing protein n=1 Tax=Pedobacter insulae TaxID=414048 RepID=A0A1I3A932_9SPHI|nr:hypothetical protein [Pedobacter insulae]SFH46425.1 hypothetical protein SAMN04489864_11385 [Pedobacter insulae]
MNIICQIVISANKAEFIQAICAVIVAVIALVALFSWRSQKRFEAVIELLINTHKAKEYMELLRDQSAGIKGYASAMSFRKTLNLKDIENIYERRMTEYQLVLEAKEPQLSELYGIVLDMRTKAWVLFGKNNKFYRFYDEIISMSMGIYFTHTAMIFTLERLIKGGLSEEDIKICQDQEYNFHDRIYRKPNDEITKKIEEMIAKLEEERPIFFWSDYEEDNYTNY